MTAPTPNVASAPYRAAYARINAMVIVGEALADRHFRQLARLIPADREPLLRLGAMEGRHASDFAGCGRHLGIEPDTGLARRLLAPLHSRFREAAAAGDRVSCLVIQCLLIECFAVASYRCYLPVADDYARGITERVLADEAEHLHYGEEWLKPRLPQVGEEVVACCRRVVPVALAILRELSADLEAIAIDPQALVAEFLSGLSESLEAIGFPPADVRQHRARLMGAALG